MVHKGRKVGTGVVIVAAFLAGGAVGAALYYLFDETNPPNSEPIVPRVRIESGRIRGMITKGVRGRKDYAAFLGVPYARPPFGPLRFKSPQPVVPWEEERDSTRFGFACRQGRADKTQVGHEDCLHANVYTPWPKREGELLPVLVKVHGGSNTEQSAIILRPDYFVEEGLIVVTFNYRLNHFGFLNLDNEVAPGNVGFKDMVFALQWVQRNIHHFGGDPRKVTLQGCSSAAGAVHWLTLLPSTEGLFRGAIIMSGSGMTPWSYTERHRDVSDVALAKLREVVPGASDEQLLQTLPADVLGIAFAYADLYRDMSRPETFMNPTVSLEDRPESETEPRLIKADAETYLLGGLPARSRVPLLFGIVQCEYTALADYHLLMGNLSPLTTDPEADRKLLAITPRTVIPTKAAQRALGLTDYKHTYEELEADIRETFFNTSTIDASCGMQCRWEAFFSETLVKVDTVRALRMDSQRGDAPVYAYRYEFPVLGTCPVHAIDDLVIWPIQNENLILDLNTTSPLALNILRQINFQANFVKEGNPVPKTDPVILTTEWSPMSKDSTDRFMRIGVNLTMDEGDLLGESGPYWLEMYSKYRDGKGT